MNNYQDQKIKAQELYYKINSVFSPALKQRVFFSADGFNHIIFQNSRSERDRSSQILRFSLIPLAVKLIMTSSTFQEYEEIFKEVTIKKYKRKIKEQKIVKYWGLIAIIDNRKIKVVIRKIGDNGALHFWSIIPAWITSKCRDAKFVMTMTGRPDED